MAQLVYKIRVVHIVSLASSANELNSLQVSNRTDVPSDQRCRLSTAQLLRLFKVLKEFRTQAASVEAKELSLTSTVARSDMQSDRVRLRKGRASTAVVRPHHKTLSIVRHVMLREHAKREQR